MFMAATLLFASIPGALADGSNTPVIKNIIYMIPDGGGMVPLELSDAVKRAGGLNDTEQYPYVTKTTGEAVYLMDYLVGAITTYSADAAITDSAAAGTALSSGIKTNNGNIGVDAELKPHATILEISQLLGKATGMVSTYDWANATPAAFSAHDNSRSNNGIISEQVVNQGIDVVLGVGFDMSGWKDIREAEKRGYDIIDNREELANVKSGDKIWGNMEEREFPYDIDNTADTVTLAEMTKGAIVALSEADEDGFFLMVEGSRVDGAGHGNSALAMVGDFLAFDEAFKVALDYAKGRNDTLVIACPDHDTGGMILPEDLTRSIADIQSRVRPEEVKWESVNHTARNGGLFLYAPEGTAYPEGIEKDAENPFETNVIDNTEIIPYLTGILGIDKDEATKELFVDVTDMGHFDGVTETFVFSDYSASVKRNGSYAFVGDKAVSLDGQVAVYVNNRFYVPQKLIDILEGKEEVAEYETSPVLPMIKYNMASAEDILVLMDIKSYFKDQAFSGYVKFSEPVELAGKSFDFEISPDNNECQIEIGDGSFNKDGAKFCYDIVFDSGKKYSFIENVNGVLYGAYTDKSITVDGVIDEKEWELAPKFVCDDVSMLTNDFENWKGFRDLSAVFAVLYDKEYLYFHATVTDEIFHQDKKADNMWEADCIQFGFFNDTDKTYETKTAGSRYDGINFGFIDGKPVAYRSQRVNYLVDKGVMESCDEFEFECSRNLNDMTYEIKISWRNLLGYDLNPKSGDMLAFSFLANDNDGEGRRGAIQYGSGIYGGKNVNQFVPMYLFDVAGIQDADCVEEGGLKLYYNNERINFVNMPYITDGRTMVAAEEFLSATDIVWSKDDAGKITIDGETPIEISDGAEIDANVSVIKDNTLYMPFRAVLEKMGKTVYWRADTTSIYTK